MIFTILSIITTHLLLVLSVNCFYDSLPDKFFNQCLDFQNPSSNWPPNEDEPGQPPFKYPFSFSHKRIYTGGWARQVTVRDLPPARRMAGVQMRLIRGGIRELHWHVSSEWAYMISGQARITAVDDRGRAFIDDVKTGDIWLFPGGIPHSVQGIGKEGAFFILVFNDGNFSEFEGTFMLTEWMRHVPKEVLAKNFLVKETTFANLPQEDLFIFSGQLPRSLEAEFQQVTQVTGTVPSSYAFFTEKLQPTVTRTGGQVKIVDANNFPVTDIAAAIVTLKPGAMRELHWHPNQDEWQYYVTGKARMSVFAGPGMSRTMDFYAGDVGYVQQSVPHYIENIGAEVLVFLEVFPTANYQDISLAEWLAHSPTLLVNQHIRTGEKFIQYINKTESVVVP